MQVSGHSEGQPANQGLSRPTTARLVNHGLRWSTRSLVNLGSTPNQLTRVSAIQPGQILVAVVSHPKGHSAQTSISEIRQGVSREWRAGHASNDPVSSHYLSAIRSMSLSAQISQSGLWDLTSQLVEQSDQWTESGKAVKRPSQTAVSESVGQSVDQSISDAVSWKSGADDLIVSEHVDLKSITARMELIS